MTVHDVVDEAAHSQPGRHGGHGRKSRPAFEDRVLLLATAHEVVPRPDAGEAGRLDLARRLKPPL